MSKTKKQIEVESLIMEHTSATLTNMAQIHLDDIPKLVLEIDKLYSLTVVSCCALSSEDFVVEEEINVKQYKCKKCGNLHVIENDKFCSECGVKVKWHCN